MLCMASDSGILHVPDADLYYEVHGRGPILVISQSGEGDANRSDALVRHLEANFRIVTYDRRGLSRSTIRGNPGASVATHADDVVRVLDHLTGEPAAMLGCSLGAAIGLHVATAYPDRLSTLIAHEPITPWILSEAACAEHLLELEEIQSCFRRGGWRAAVAPMVRSLGIDPASQEHEPGVELPPITREREANFVRFLGHDVGAARCDRLEVGDVRDSPVRIIPAAGSLTPHHVFDYQCAQQLAAVRGTSLISFPGGHNGNLTHPARYARVLGGLL